MLTRHAARGASLMLAASLLGRAAALIAQIVTGFVLVDSDFGIFAAAIGVQAIAGLLRGGDVQSYLVTLPPAIRRRRTGTVFWLSMAMYGIGLIPMLALGPRLAVHFEDHRIVPLLWILGVTMCLSPLRYVLRARVNARLRFGANAMATLVNNFTTYPLTIVLALVLRDPVALAAPVLFGSIAELVYLWRVAAPHRTDFIPHRRFVRPVLHQLRWLIAVAAMMSLWTSGDYFVAEFLVPTTVLGLYYFAYQLAVQPGRLFTTTVVNVLVPVVRRVIDDRERLRRALERLVGTGGFAIAMVNVSMVALIGPLERLVWNGRWEDAVLPVQVLSAGLTYTAVLGIATAPLMAERRYVATLISNGARAVGVIGGAALGSMYAGSALGIAVWVSGSMAATSLITIAWVAARYGVPGLPLLGRLLRCTVPVMIAGIGGAFVADRVAAMVDVPGRLAALVSGPAAAAAYGAAAILALLLLPRATRTEVVGLLPSPWRRGARDQTPRQDA